MANRSVNKGAYYTVKIDSRGNLGKRGTTTPIGVIYTRQGKLDKRMYPALEKVATLGVKYAKEELERKLSKNSWQWATGHLKEAIRIFYGQKQYMMIGVGVDLKRAPYGEYVEAGHYFSLEFAAHAPTNWREKYVETKVLHRGVQGEPTVWRATWKAGRRPRKAGYWFMRTGINRAYDEGKKYILRCVGDYIHYGKTPDGKVEPMTLDTGNQQYDFRPGFGGW